MRRAVGRWLERNAPHLRQRLHRARRRGLEAIGNDTRSRPSLHQIEDRLDGLFGGQPGFFVEAGAFDGFDQSNTYWLERFRGWRGVLIEALPAEAARARRVRSRGTQVLNYALGPPEQAGQPMSIQYAGLMSIAKNVKGSDAADWKYVSTGLAVQHIESSYTLEVECRTLSSLLDEAGAPRDIDLLSLDVEGMETGVLAGLDIDRHAPRYVLVEMNTPDATDRLLRQMGYRCFDGDFTPNDALYARPAVP